jgi:hypothetical protein
MADTQLLRVQWPYAALRKPRTVSGGSAYASVPLERGLLRTTTSLAHHALESLL